MGQRKILLPGTLFLCYCAVNLTLREAVCSDSYNGRRGAETVSVPALLPSKEVLSTPPQVQDSFPCSSMRSLSQDTVLHKPLQCESLPQATALPELLHHRPLL